MRPQICPQPQRRRTERRSKKREGDFYRRVFCGCLSFRPRFLRSCVSPLRCRCVAIYCCCRRCCLCLRAAGKGDRGEEGGKAPHHVPCSLFLLLCSSLLSSSLLHLLFPLSLSPPHHLLYVNTATRYKHSTRARDAAASSSTDPRSPRLSLACRPSFFNPCAAQKGVEQHAMRLAPCTLRRRPAAGAFAEREKGRAWALKERHTASGVPFSFSPLP